MKYLLVPHGLKQPCKHQDLIQHEDFLLTLFRYGMQSKLVSYCCKPSFLSFVFFFGVKKPTFDMLEMYSFVPCKDLVSGRVL